jgi:hypothetical protein
MPSSRFPRTTKALTLALLPLVALMATGGCGSGGGGGGGGSGEGVVLVAFLQSSEDNVALNGVLEFRFSSAINPDTVSQASMQIRASSSSFGQAVEGRYIVQGSTIYFEPRLPSDCTLADSGFTPDTQYRVTLIGAPEEFALRALTGEALEHTISLSFHTRGELDPLGLYDDQVPGAFPTVIGHSPTDGAYPPVFPEVNIGPENKVTIDFSENIDPCTVGFDQVRVLQVATGNPSDFPNGFSPDVDQTPGDPYSWGSGTPTSPAQRIRASYFLTQTFLSTRLEIIPEFGEFPDNALIVVEVTNQVKDFGGNPLLPKTFAFVTENRTEQCKAKLLKFDGDVPIDTNRTTADVDTARAPDRAQAFLLFAGDGDNGSNVTKPSGPNCPPYHQDNDNTPDDFDTVSADVTLDTGSSVNTSCNNETDGSTAVVFEYRTFRIRGTRTVTIVGKNPAIILVSGDAIIESGGRLMVKGATGESGQSGYQYPNGPTPRTGGLGVAGGGQGGDSIGGSNAGSASTAVYGENGDPGIGSPDYLTPGGMGGSDPILVGPGRGNVSVSQLAGGYSSPANRYGPGGGGGGHAQPGNPGAANFSGSQTSPATLQGSLDGAGGGTYGDLSGRMLTPEAGSGGGAGGYARAYYTTTTYYVYYDGQGAAAGGGGGFVDITAGGNIKVFGRIDAAGGAGGGVSSISTNFQTGGGGGGGSGGGVRLLTPNSIEVGSTTTITAAGGAGGNGGTSTSNPPAAPANPGGSGGAGRLVFEDGDSVITGYPSAVAIVPGETSSAGFYRGPFDPSRFQGGGLSATVLTGVMDMGPTRPLFQEPIQSYGGQEDFVAGIPTVASRGVGLTSIFIEVQGYPAKVDGTADLTAPTGWKHVGYFTDSGAETFPNWNLGTPIEPSLVIPPDGVPGGMAAVDNNEFVQFRITFFMKSGVGPFDPGPYIDDWNVQFCYNQ